MSKAAICVVVPVYKAMATLDRCVESVLAQQVEGGLTCILVDDGSPDESGALCDAWAAKDDRVTVIHQDDLGVSGARNSGLAAADSEFIVFLDSDDALRPGALQAALTAQGAAPQDFVVWHYTTDAKDPAAECRRYETLLKNYPADIVCLGIGENGHIAFNDPWVADFEDSSLVKTVPLDEICRRQQVHDGCFASLGQVPKTAVTLTVPALTAAPYLFCTVPSKTKRAAVNAAVNGEISVDCPASVLRCCQNAVLYCDEESGQDLL